MALVMVICVVGLLIALSALAAEIREDGWS